MKRRLINKYITAEILPNFAVNILVFTAILLMARVMELTSLVIGRGVGVGDVFRVVMLLMPKILSMTIPMAALLAVLTAFLRLSADSELTVLRASGISLYQMLPPVLLFGAAASILTASFTVWLAPEANWDLKDRLLSLAKKRADLAIQEQVFVRNFPGVLIYVGQIEPGGDELGQVFIQQDEPESGESAVIVAQRGRLGMDGQSGVLLFHLEDGVIDRVYKDRPESDSVFFKTYELKMSPGPEFSQNGDDGLSKSRSEIPTDELLDRAAELTADDKLDWARVYTLEWHRRWAFPAAAFIMSLAGLPLGASFRVRGRNFALVMGLFVFVLYYVLFSVGWSLGEAGHLPPVVGVWIGNAISLILGLALLRAAGRGSAIDPVDFVRRLTGRARRGRLCSTVKLKKVKP